MKKTITTIQELRDYLEFTTGRKLPNNSKYRTVLKRFLSVTPLTIETNLPNRFYGTSKRKFLSILHIGGKGYLFVRKDFNTDEYVLEEKALSEPHYYFIRKDMAARYNTFEDGVLCITNEPKNESSQKKVSCFVNKPMEMSWKYICERVFLIFEDKLVSEKNNCCKCGGAGKIKQYAHIDNGTCWDCFGTGGDYILTEDFKKFTNK